MISSDYQIRPATMKDADFIIETIVEAEKSGTDKLGLSTLFNLSENQVRQSLLQILSEEIDGCEFSISSFIVAEAGGKPVAAIAGWIEGDNEDNQPSGLLKSNLLGFVLPPESLTFIQRLSSLIEGIQIEREKHTYQIEYVYVSSDFRGKGLVQELLQAHTERATIRVSKMQVQAFSNNLAAIKTYEKYGFKIVREFKTTDNDVLNYLPDNKKYLLEINLN